MSRVIAAPYFPHNLRAFPAIYRLPIDTLIPTSTYRFGVISLQYLITAAEALSLDFSLRSRCAIGTPLTAQMRLRRGMIRESCDFCHRRKIKCDRLPRNGQGHTSCSQCSLRNVQCRMDDSDDIRLRTRYTPTASGRRALRHKSAGPLPSDAASPAASISALTSASADTRSPSSHTHLPLLPPPPSSHLAVAPVTPLPASPYIAPSPYLTAPSLAAPSSLQPPLSLDTQLPPSIGNPPPISDDLLFLDTPFQLNADSVFFLDQIFTGYPDAPFPLVWSANPQFPTAAMPVDLQPLVLTQPLDAAEGIAPTAATIASQMNVSSQKSQKQSSVEGAIWDGGYDPPPWERCSVTEDVFIDALRAYFAYTNLYLPVLLEDAFWQDYHAGRSSLCIIFAVACRGLPFAMVPGQAAGFGSNAGDSNEEKWAMQQRVAEQFREAFFATQLAANNNRGRIRLDDLEALAIMVSFKPGITVTASASASGTASASPLAQLHAHLAGLYLTHDSLVLMTMQSGINGSDTGDGSGDSNNESTSNNLIDPSAALARLHDRRVLLFWHVFGLDAFHCLDKRTLSRIPDGSAINTLSGSSIGKDRSTSGSRIVRTAAPATKTSSSLPRIDARSYLDAVLDLAVIARRILVTLSNTATARRLGVSVTDVNAMYDLLDQWQLTKCPPRLRRQRDPATGKLSLTMGLERTGTGAFSGKYDVQQLHRAVVWILEINCYMQIEAYVREYGIQQENEGGTADGSSLIEAERMAMQVESISLQQFRDGVDVARSIVYDMQRQARDGQGRSGSTHYSMADLGTSVVRDCCIGLCYWACQHGSEWLQRPLPGLLRSRGLADADRKRQHVASYVEAAKALRDVVATAVSHSDTKQIVDKLDSHIVQLSTVLEGATQQSHTA